MGETDRGLVTLVDLSTFNQSRQGTAGTNFGDIDYFRSFFFYLYYIQIDTKISVKKLEHFLSAVQSWAYLMTNG